MLTLAPLLRSHQTLSAQTQDEAFPALEPVMPRRISALPLALVVVLIALLLASLVWLLMR